MAKAQRFVRQIRFDTRWRRAQRSLMVVEPFQGSDVLIIAGPRVVAALQPWAEISERLRRIVSAWFQIDLLMRNKTQVAGFLALLVLSAITIHAQIFFEDRVNVPFAPDQVPDGVTWSSTVSLRDGGLFSEKLPSM